MVFRRFYQHQIDYLPFYLCKLIFLHKSLNNSQTCTLNLNHNLCQIGFAFHLILVHIRMSFIIKHQSSSFSHFLFEEETLRNRLCVCVSTVHIVILCLRTQNMVALFLIETETFRADERLTTQISKHKKCFKWDNQHAIVISQQLFMCTPNSKSRFFN